MNDQNLNSNIEKRNLTLAFILIGGFVLSIIIIALLIFIKETGSSTNTKSPGPTPSSTRKPTPTISLDLNYSKINTLKIGESNLNDVLSINGRPEFQRSSDSGTLLFYKTPIEGKYNTVALSNGTVSYSLENVFGDYRDNVSSYRNKYGNPDLVLYMDGDAYPWDIYLSDGIAFENDGKDVGAILYFAPQTQTQFLNTLGVELNFSSAPPEEE